MNKTALEWIRGNDAGTSSKTIWSVMMDLVPKETRCDIGNGLDIPYDPSDIGRCFRLLGLIPERRMQIEKMNILPKWRPFVREWERMEGLYKHGEPCPELYKLMQELIHEGMILDGWKKTEYGWTRGEGYKTDFANGISISGGDGA